jgi:hypothetical protein
MRLPVSRERFEEMKARAEWAESELRKAEAAALTAKIQLQGCEKAMAQLEKELAAVKDERARFDDLLTETLKLVPVDQPIVEDLGTVEAQTPPKPAPVPERKQPHVLSPLEVVSRATEHRNLHRAAIAKTR